MWILHIPSKRSPFSTSSINFQISEFLRVPLEESIDPVSVADSVRAAVVEAAVEMADVEAAGSALPESIPAATAGSAHVSMTGSARVVAVSAVVRGED